MAIATMAEWARHLRTLAGELPPPGTPLGAGAIDGPLLAAAAGRSIEVPSRWQVPSREGGERRVDAEIASDPLDVRLWWLVHQPSASLEAILDPRGTGPLLPPGGRLAIEVWTECELCALHALGRIVATRFPAWHRPGAWPQSTWSVRLESARRWHLEHTQPDNATGRPWAIAVFASDPAVESQLYAQTLLHNAQVAGATSSRSDGGLEPLSAVILADAASVLRVMTASDPSSPPHATSGDAPTVPAGGDATGRPPDGVWSTLRTPDGGTCSSDPRTLLP